MRRADARNAAFLNHTFAVSTGKLGDKDDQFRLMPLKEPAQYFLGYFTILGHDVSFYATTGLRRWPHKVVIKGDVIKGEFVRHQATFLQYPNNFFFDYPIDSMAVLYAVRCVHPRDFFRIEVALVALVPACRIKVDSGFGRHIVTLADHQQPLVAVVPIGAADPRPHAGKVF